MSWRDEPTQAESRRRRVARLLDVLVGCQLAWLGLHHVSLVWCVDPYIVGRPQTGLSAALRPVERRLLAPVHLQSLPMLFDLLCYGAVLVPVLVLAGRKLGYRRIPAFVVAAEEAIG